MSFKPSSNFYWRLLSAVLLGPLVLAAAYMGEPVYAALVAVTVVIGFSEWLRLVDLHLPRPLYVALLLALGLVIAAGAFTPFLGATWRLAPFIGVMMLAVMTLLGLFFLLLAKRRAVWLDALGLPYLGGAALALLALRDAPDDGLMLTYYLFAVVWGTDIGGYVTGRLIGGPKLASRISPGKTWAGFCGGLVLAAILGYMAVLWSQGHGAVIAGMIALPLAAVSQIGDLWQSFFKRRAGVKDSGRLIPGHGGVLDRADGLIFAAIAFALLRGFCPLCVNWW